MSEHLFVQCHAPCFPLTLFVSSAVAAKAVEEARASQLRLSADLIDASMASDDPLRMGHALQDSKRVKVR